MTSIPCINVQDYGAVGDGTTDDTADIQAALDDAISQGQILFFPAGTYRIEQPLKIRVAEYLSYAVAFGPGPRIMGAGSGHTVIASGVDNGAAFDLDGGLFFTADTTASDDNLTDISVDANQFTPGGHVFGASIPIDSMTGMTATVQSVVSSTEVDLSANATATVNDEAMVYRFRAMLGTTIQGLTIKPYGSPTNSTGIGLRAGYHVKISDVHIIGMSGDGILFTGLHGDAFGSDTCNMVELEQVRIENCAGWGISAACAEGVNELSYLRLQQVFIDECGSDSETVPPPSGGMIWKGQGLTLDQCAFTQNENVALFIRGQSGLAQSVYLETTTFENNKRKSLYCTGLDAFKARNIQVYNSVAGVATVGLEFTIDAAPPYYPLQKIDIDGVVVRATPQNNPFTAFKLTQESELILNDHRIRNVVWENFGYTGQIGFDGWTFDTVPNECRLTEDSGQIMLLPDFTKGGNKVPYRQAWGGVSGQFFETGPWMAFKMRPTGLARAYSGNNDEGGALADNTTYNVYLYDNGNLPALGLSTTAPVLDVANGYPVKDSDESRYFVGRWRVESGAFLAGAAANWLNPTQIAGGWYWTSAGGDAMVKAGSTFASLPSSDTDGTVIGTQS